MYRALSVAVSDVVDEGLDQKPSVPESELEVLTKKAADRFSTEAWKILKFSQANALSEGSNLDSMNQQEQFTINPSDEAPIQRLVSCGFKIEQAIEAYKITNKDANAALELLCQIREQTKTQ